jgi:hypothetical protein
MRIFRVTLKDGNRWTGAASTFADAVKTACKGFLCPESAIKSVVVIKEIK